MERWVHRAAVIDLFSRRIVGWSSGLTLETDLAIRALVMAPDQWHHKLGLVAHTDRGVQYASQAFLDVLARHGLVPSMSRRANAFCVSPLCSYAQSTASRSAADVIRHPRSSRLDSNNSVVIAPFHPAYLYPDGHHRETPIGSLPYASWRIRSSRLIPSGVMAQLLSLP